MFIWEHQNFAERESFTDTIHLYRTSTNSLHTHNVSWFVVCCEPKSRYQYTSACSCHWNVAINSLARSAGRSITPLLSLENYCWTHGGVIRLVLFMIKKCKTVDHESTMAKYTTSNSREQLNFGSLNLS